MHKTFSVTARTVCVVRKPSRIISSIKYSWIGVPQGTLFGPALRNVFVNDPQPSADTVKYADDTTIYVFTSSIRPILCYAARAWYPYLSNYPREKLERAQRQCWRDFQTQSALTYWTSSALCIYPDLNPTVRYQNSLPQEARDQAG